MKNLIIINGVMGVGKTAVSEKLLKQLPNAIWLDGDWCWMMDPFIVNDVTKKMVIDNITYQLNNFLRIDEFENIIFNWVIDEESIYDAILSRLNGEYNLFKITLICKKETLINRINQDIKDNKRDKENLERSLSKFDKYAQLNSIKVRTDNLSINQIVVKIKEIIKSD